MDFIKWYKNIIESGQEYPPPKVWEEIQDELDVENVWQNIDTGLTRNKRRNLYSKIAAAASFLLIISFGTIYFSGLLHQNKPDIYVLESIEIDENYALEPINIETSHEIQLPSADYKPELSTTEIHDIDEIKDIHDNYLISAQVVKLEALPKPLIVQEMSLTISKIKSKAQDYQISELLAQSEPLGLKDNYYAGISGHAANTWLLNNKTIQGMQRDDLTATIPSFGYNFGIIAGKHLRRNLDIQAGLYFIQQNRQNYNEYIHGQYVNNNLQFNYSSFAFTSRWSYLTTENQGAHSLVMGAYTSVLKNAMQKLNGASISVSDEYNSIDYGIITGYEYLYDIKNSITISAGIQTRYGLKNIFSGNEYIPDYFNDTRNMSINLILSVKYNIN